MIQPELKVFAISALKREGIVEWCRYLEEERLRLLQRR